MKNYAYIKNGSEKAVKALEYNLFMEWQSIKKNKLKEK
jgi:hypothetical protein